MTDKKVQIKIQRDIEAQGFSCVKGPAWFFTVGMGRKGRKDIIMPATVNYIAFQSLAALYYEGKIELDKKFINEQVTIKTELMGVEPARFVLRQIDKQHQDFLKQQLTSGLVEEAFEGFLTIDAPDNDNQLFGEPNCVVSKNSETVLVGIVEAMHTQAEQKRIADIEEAKRVKEVLERNRPQPLNRPKPSPSKNIRKPRVFRGS